MDNMYTPYVYEDVPKEGVPRITDEEFSELSDAAFAKRRAEDVLYKIKTRILQKYGKREYENVGVDGLPETYWSIQGHNVEKMTVVY